MCLVAPRWNRRRSLRHRLSLDCCLRHLWVYPRRPLDCYPHRLQRYLLLTVVQRLRRV